MTFGACSTWSRLSLLTTRTPFMRQISSLTQQSTPTPRSSMLARGRGNSKILYLWNFYSVNNLLLLLRKRGKLRMKFNQTVFFFSFIIKDRTLTPPDPSSWTLTPPDPSSRTLTPPDPSSWTLTPPDPSSWTLTPPDPSSWKRYGRP